MTQSPPPAAPRVVTRFAPSPTGNLHIGGARTALYAWAYAHHPDRRAAGSKFLLRFEDTDRKRSSEASAAGILRDLQWLGLDWDEPDAGPKGLGRVGLGDDGIPRQSLRHEAGVYQRFIDALKAAGLAYEEPDGGGAIRFRMGQDVTFEDAVYGTIHTPGADLEDFIIQKGVEGGGLPTFHFAVVVDDALMGVTHVIRGQEHLTNTAKHAALYDALSTIALSQGLPPETFGRPVWAHTPSILNPDGSKMSKRDKAKAARAAAQTHGLTSVGVDDERVTAFLQKLNDDGDLAMAIADKLGVALPEIEVADFRHSGYLPAPLLNYLSLLGWNPGGDVERFDLDFLSQRFSLDRINKANSKFDREKLAAFSQDAIKALPQGPPDAAGSLAHALHAHATSHADAFVALLGASQAWPAFAEAYRERAKTLADPFAQGAFFVEEDDSVKERIDQAIAGGDKGVKKALFKGNDGDRGIDHLRAFAPELEALPEAGFGAAAHAAMERWCAEHPQGPINMGKIAQPIRVAVAGSPVTPPIDLTLEILGKPKTLNRVAALLAAVPQ